MRVAFATCSKFPDLYEGDQLARDVLKERGIEVEPLIWDQPNGDLARFSAIVVRSTWDYWLKYPAFLAWLDEVERSAVPMLNPVSTLRENTRKTYLRRLAQEGIPTIPTRWVSSVAQVRQVFGEMGWSEGVLKPAVSANAFRTYRVSPGTLGDEIETKLTEILSESEAMLQPLVQAILKEGEYSFLFFGGEFSHAVLKRGVPGEFRIQEKYGGKPHPYPPKQAEIAQARAVLTAWRTPLLYARVDMVRDERDKARLLLMELEAAEPSLFLHEDQANPGAATRFSDALLRALRSVTTKP